MHKMEGNYPRLGFYVVDMGTLSFENDMMLRWTTSLCEPRNHGA
jgi:hypothetical protein